MPSSFKEILGCKLEVRQSHGMQLPCMRSLLSFVAFYAEFQDIPVLPPRARTALFELKFVGFDTIYVSRRYGGLSALMGCSAQSWHLFFRINLPDTQLWSGLLRLHHICIIGLLSAACQITKAYSDRCLVFCWPALGPRLFHGLRIDCSRTSHRSVAVQVRPSSADTVINVEESCMQQECDLDGRTSPEFMWMKGFAVIEVSLLCQATFSRKV